MIYIDNRKRIKYNLMQSFLTSLYFNSSSRFQIERRIIYALKQRPPIRHTIEALEHKRRCIDAHKFKSAREHNASPCHGGVISARNDKTLEINIPFCLLWVLYGRGAFRWWENFMRHKSAETSCVRYRDWTRHVCAVKHSPIFASAIDMTYRTKATTRRREGGRAWVSLLFNIRDDIWTRSRVGLTGCRSAWARSILRGYDGSVLLRDACKAFISASRCLRNED